MQSKKAQKNVLHNFTALQEMRGFQGILVLRCYGVPDYAWMTIGNPWETKFNLFGSTNSFPFFMNNLVTCLKGTHMISLHGMDGFQPCL